MSTAWHFDKRAAVPALLSLFVVSLAVPGAIVPGLVLLATAALLSLAGDAPTHTDRRWDPLSLTLVAFVLVSIVSVFGSSVTQRAVETSYVLVPAALFYALVRFHCAPSHLRWIACSFTTAAAVVGCIVLAVARKETDTDPSFLMSRVPLNYFSVPNDLVLIALTVPLAFAMLSGCVSPTMRTLLVASLLPGLAAIIVYRSNAALLALLCGVTLMSLLTRKQHIVIGLAALILGILAFDALNGFSLLGKFAHATVWGNRLPLWLAAWQMFLDAPLLGHGPGAFSQLYSYYAADARLPTWIDPDPRHAPWAHSLYLELLAERGLAGLLSFVAAIVLAVRRLWQSRTAGAPMAAWPAALVSALFAFLVVGLFDMSLLRQWNLIFLAFVLAGTGLVDTTDPTPTTDAR